MIGQIDAKSPVRTSRAPRSQTNTLARGLSNLDGAGYSFTIWMGMAYAKPSGRTRQAFRRPARAAGSGCVPDHAQVVFDAGHPRQAGNDSLGIALLIVRLDHSVQPDAAAD